MGQPYLGEIRLFAGNFAPLGWEFCHGQLLPISENETLFNLIGTTYGGDGEETFRLPDLRGRVTVHQGTGTATGGTYQLAETGGVEDVMLSQQQIPSHTHPLMVSGGPATQDTPAAGVLAVPPTARRFAEGGATVALSAEAAGTSGGSQPHDNMQPYLGLSHIISLFGLFPSPY